MSDQPRMDHPDVAADESQKLREAGIAVEVDDRLVALRDHVVATFPDLGVVEFRDQLTLEAKPDVLLDLLRFCKQDEAVRCELLADLTCVHWPGGRLAVQAQETTGWPTYVEDRAGRIAIDYVLYSLTHNHRFRIRVLLGDDAPRIDSATSVYGSANFMEREAYDFFGVTFAGHPNLVRTHMPDDWEGHPLRKDYPLGGVDVTYKGATIPPPDERKY